MLFGDILFASGYDCMMSVRGSKYLLVYFCSYIFIAFLCIDTYAAHMCVFNCKDCWFSWSLLNTWQPSDILRHWVPVCNHDSISPGNQGRAGEWKKHTLGQSRVKSSGAEVSRPWGFVGSRAELQLAYIMFQDLPGEYRMCEHEKPFGCVGSNLG